MDLGSTPNWDNLKQINLSSSGGSGRHKGLKILYLLDVWVQVPPGVVGDVA